MTTKQEMRELRFGPLSKKHHLTPSQCAFVWCPAWMVLPNSFPFAQAIYQWAFDHAVLQTEASEPPAHFDPNWN
jgi:hypothetical protein